jgi:hypothetical protein
LKTGVPRHDGPLVPVGPRIANGYNVLWQAVSLHLSALPAQRLKVLKSGGAAMRSGVDVIDFKRAIRPAGETLLSV